MLEILIDHLATSSGDGGYELLVNVAKKDWMDRRVVKSSRASERAEPISTGGDGRFGGHCSS